MFVFYTDSVVGAEPMKTAEVLPTDRLQATAATHSPGPSWMEKLLTDLIIYLIPTTFGHTDETFRSMELMHFKKYQQNRLLIS